MISNAKMLAQRLGEQGPNEPTHGMVKPEPKSDKPYRKWGSAYRAPESFKPFESELEVKFLEVLTMNPVHVFNAIKGKQRFPPARPMYQDTDKLNSSKFCYYHNVGHTV